MKKKADKATGKDRLLRHYEQLIFDLEQMLDIARSFASALKWENLLDSIVFSCMSHMRVSDAGIFVRGFLDGAPFKLVTGKTKTTEDISINSSDPMILLLQERKKPISFKQMVRLSGRNLSSLNFFVSKKVTLFVPLILESGMNGVLYLGERLKDEAAFSKYEKTKVEIIASFAAITIHNAGLLELSSIDKMTKLREKHFFFNELTTSLLRAESDEEKISVLMIDIDFFKRFNDTYGHECGDVVLIEVAALIKSSLNTGEIAGRYGGEEFTVLFRDTDEKKAVSRAENLCEMIRKAPLRYKTNEIKVTVSIGVAQNDKANASELVSRADFAMYAAKKSGRDCVRAWSDLEV